MNQPAPHSKFATIPQQSIYEKGYVVLKNIYSEREIKFLRNIFDNLFNDTSINRSTSDSSKIINDIYRHRPSLAPIIFNEKYFNGIKSLIGDDIVWLPECAIHRDRYAKWHKDTTEQEIKGITSHLNEPSPLLQVSTYLQDYSKMEGGGITVVPGSHLNADRFLDMYSFGLKNRIKRKIKKLIGKTIFQQIEKRKEYIDLNTKATDLSIFDIRTEHRASLPLTKPALIKHAIFNTFGKKTKALKEYFDFMKQRSEPYYLFYKNFEAPKILEEIANQYKVELWA